MVPVHFLSIMEMFQPTHTWACVQGGAAVGAAVASTSTNRTLTQIHPSDAAVELWRSLTAGLRWTTAPCVGRDGDDCPVDRKWTDASADVVVH